MVDNVSVPRLFTAMATPYNENLEVDYDQAAVLANYLIDNGSDGLVIAGSTGETSVLSQEEKLQLLEVVLDAVGKKAKVWVGTGLNDTKSTIALNQAVEKYPVAGVMSVCPYYNKATQEGMYQHFKLIAQNTSHQVMVYNVPGRTGNSITPATMERLAEFENISAIKESSASMDQIAELMRMLPERVLIYSGDDNMTLPMLSVGAVGVISVASHIAGNQIKAMLQAFFDGDAKKARDLHLELYPLFRGLFITSNPIPVKKALNLIGMRVGGLRLPLVEASESETAFLKNLVAGYQSIKN